VSDDFREIVSSKFGRSMGKTQSCTVALQKDKQLSTKAIVAILYGLLLHNDKYIGFS
jgi:hypothetical protein